MKRTHLSRRLTVLAAVGALALASACGGRDDGGGDSGGIKTGPGFDGQTIKLGVLTPTSGTVSVIGNPVTTGNQIYFDKLNAEGGVAGKYKVELVVRDTKYEAPTASQEYQATKSDVAMYLQILGTQVVSSLLPDLENDNVIASPASLDSFWVREPNLLPWGGPYQIQVINGISWYMTEGGGKGSELCSMVQDDAYGATGQQGLDHVASELDLDTGVKVDFSVGTPDFTTHINQLQSDGCETVLLTATPADAAGAIGKAAQAGFTPKWLVQSPGWLKALFSGDLRPYAEANVLILAEGGAWDASASKGMADLLDALKAYAPDATPDWYMTVGWTQAKATHQVLEAAVKNGDLSRDGLMKAMNSLDVIKADGLFGDYAWGDAETRNPPRSSTIYGVDIEGSPIGLVPLVQDYTSDAAKSYSFEE